MKPGLAECSGGPCLCVARSWSTALTRTIVVIAHHLALKVIAKGVETYGQVLELTATGCDLLQNYRLGRRQPAEALTAQWMAHRGPK